MPTAPAPREATAVVLKQFNSTHQEEEALQRLVPNPPRCCSRQTGAIVTRNYDMGANPYYINRRDRGSDALHELEKRLDYRSGNAHQGDLVADIISEDDIDHESDYHASGAEDSDGEAGKSKGLPRFKVRKSSVPELPHIPKYRVAAGILAKAVDTNHMSIGKLVAKLPSIRKEEEKRQVRKRCLKKHNYFERRRKKDNKAASFRHGYQQWSIDQAGVDENGELLVQKLVNTVLGLDAQVQEERSLMGAEPDAHGQKKTMSGLKIQEDDPARAFSLGQYRRYFREFERFQMEGKFLGALSMKAPLIWMEMLVTPDMIRKAIDDQLDMDFLELIHACMPVLSVDHLRQLRDTFHKMEDERQRMASNFRDKYNLATVRDIQRCFEIALRKYSKKERLSKQTREPGLTEDEYVKFSFNNNPTLSEEEVRLVFREHSVEPVGNKTMSSSRRGSKNTISRRGSINITSPLASPRQSPKSGPKLASFADFASSKNLSRDDAPSIRLELPPKPKVLPKAKRIKVPVQRLDRSVNPKGPAPEPEKTPADPLPDIRIQVSPPLLGKTTGPGAPSPRSRRGSVSVRSRRGSAAAPNPPGLGLLGQTNAPRSRRGSVAANLGQSRVDTGWNVNMTLERLITVDEFATIVKGDERMNESLKASMSLKKEVR